MEDDIIATERELGHVESARCELCGRVLPVNRLDRESIDTGGGVEPAEAIRVCPACKQELAAEDTLPLDAGVGAGLLDVEE